MFKLQLDKELQTKKTSDIKQFDALKETKLLLQGDESEDLRIANGLGQQHTIVRAQNEFGKKLELEKLDDSFDGAVFTIDQIRSLALKYNLRFLPSTMFTSTIEVEALSKIKDFAKKTNSSIDDYSLTKKFYILAPEKCFELKEERIPKVVKTDPALFYKIDETHYKLIHKWGVDFSVTRLISGFKWLSAWNWWLHRMAISFPIVTVLLALATSSMFPVIYPWAFWSIAGIITVAYSSICIPCLFWNNEDIEERFFGPGKWNSNVKLKR